MGRFWREGRRQGGREEGQWRCDRVPSPSSPFVDAQVEACVLRVDDAQRQNMTRGCERVQKAIHVTALRGSDA